jgi:hypothetical protein
MVFEWLARQEAHAESCAACAIAEGGCAGWLPLFAVSSKLPDDNVTKKHAECTWAGPAVFPRRRLSFAALDLRAEAEHGQRQARAEANGCSNKHLLAASSKQQAGAISKQVQSASRCNQQAPTEQARPSRGGGNDGCG